MTAEPGRNPLAAGARYTTDIVVIDLEASSPGGEVVDVRRSNVIEIGAVRLDGRTLEVKDTFSELVRPRDYPITPFITGMTGISPEMVSGRDEFSAVGQRFIQWHGARNKAMLAAFGAYYDLPLLRKEYESVGVRFRDHFVGSAMDVRAVALIWLAQNRHNTTGVTIEKTLEKMGLGDLGLDFHRALDDARGAAAILQFFHLGAARV